MIQKIKSYAKINLFLYVTSKRKDGYHNLYSLMTRIDLFDDIHLDFSGSRISVSCDHPDVPEDESNIACKAASKFFSLMNEEGKTRGFAQKNPGVSIHITKRIPPGGGLGGGSSNAAAVLHALQNFYGNPLSRKKLMETALTLGADVPFFLFDSPAIAKGVGERLEKAPPLPDLHIILCCPCIHSSTAEVYKNIDFQLTSRPEYNINDGLKILLKDRTFDLGSMLHNDLEAPACRLYPEIRQIKKEMGSFLGKSVLMSGSGSSLFALFESKEEALPGYKTLTEKWKERQIFLTSFRQDEQQTA